MAYVTANRHGGFEVRESRATPAGPRSRTLASFRVLDSAVIERARQRSKAATPPDAEELREAALRAGAPLAAEPVDRAAAETLRRLARGERLDPMLRRLLLDALGRQERREGGDPATAVSDEARAASQWIGVDPESRGEALRELLELADAPPGSGPAEIDSPTPRAATEARPSLPEKVTAIHRALQSARVPHAIGGALALAYYGEPRATVDIDVNVFVPVERWPEVRDALAPLDIDVTADEAKLAHEGAVKLGWGRNPVHLFISRDPLHDEMRRAARRLPFAKGTIPVVAPEHLAIRKAILDRPKDWTDVEQILVATDPFVLPEVEAWLASMVGESNSRLEHLREIAARLGRA